MHPNDDDAMRNARVARPAVVDGTGMASLLDPADWDAMRRLGHRMVEEVLDSQETMRDRPVWRSVPPEVRSRLEEPLPRQGIGAEAAYEEFRELVMPYPLGNVHPRFWGWVNGAGTPFTTLAELLAANLNSNVFGSDTSPHWVELQVVRWMSEMTGFGQPASGLLVSGCSVANLTALAAALAGMAEIDLAELGIGAVPRRMIVYASTSTHYSVDKAVRLLGLGNASLRRIPTDAGFRLRVDLLRQAVADDRRRGLLPFCVVANAGTVDVGAFDPLAELADLCSGEGLWLHVDGAIGALAAASRRLAERTRGMDRADSLAFDLHKWLHMPIDVGCVLVRDAAAHRKAFAADASYLRRSDGGIAAVDPPFGSLGVELTRPFRALKVWLGLKEQGLSAYVAAAERNVRQAQYLAGRIIDRRDLELLAPTPLHIVNFRWVGDDREQPWLDDLNASLLVRLQESGRVAPSGNTIAGRQGIRVAINNHRTSHEDLDLLVEETLRHGASLAAERRDAGEAPAAAVVARDCDEEVTKK